MVSRPAPVCLVGPYEFHPLRVCSEDAIAALFAKICNRGNPLLQGKPRADLLLLGAAMYRKSVLYAQPLVCLMDGEPVALSFGWDCADGGVWQGAAGPPASLLAHSAVGSACFGSWPAPLRMPERRGEIWFGAFAGVSVPHPGILMAVMALIAFPVVIKLGFQRQFGYVVHPKLLDYQRLMRENGSHKTPSPEMHSSWEINFSEIEVDDQDVKAELSSLKPGYTTCSISDLKMMTETFGGGQSSVATEAAKAAGERLAVWDSEAYHAQAPIVIALPTIKAAFEQESSMGRETSAL